MFYARWCKDKEMKDVLNKINIKKEEVTSTGTPIIVNDDNFYVTNEEAHALVIGAIGSGKTQTVILPTTKLALLAGESVVINDPKGELFKDTAHNFKEKGYNVVKTGNTNSTTKTSIINRTNQKTETTKELKEILKVGTTSQNSNNSDVDYTIILGKDYK